jgi:hypothetical protein
VGLLTRFDPLAYDFRAVPGLLQEWRDAVSRWFALSPDKGETDGTLCEV